MKKKNMSWAPMRIIVMLVPRAVMAKEQMFCTSPYYGAGHRIAAARHTSC
jgi:hypothetical protein